jgi:ADP-ribosylglycohydrolase
MLGAIAGDIIGSVHEFCCGKTMDFPLFTPQSRFTDDTVLTVAVADCLMSRTSYTDKFHEYTVAYPDRGYGLRFMSWVHYGQRAPYNSWGNGSAMRVSPVAYAFDTLERALHEAKASAEITHNHPEGIRGALATTMAIFMARRGASKEEIRNAIQQQIGYNLSRSTAEIRETYSFNESCQETVPEAITTFLDSNDYEDAIRLAISLGGDADTLACIAGGIAEAFYGSVPDHIAKPALERLDEKLRNTVLKFRERYQI